MRTALFAAKNLGRGGLNVLLVVVPLTFLSLGGSGVGWLTAAVGGGGVLGGIAAAWLVGRRQMDAPMAAGLAVWGLPLVVLGGEPGLAVAVAGLLVLGAGNTVTDVAGYTLIARSARDDVLASVYAVHEAIRALAICAGAGIVALLVDTAGERAALVAAGLFLVAAGIVGSLLRRRDAHVEVNLDDLRLVRGNPLFGWLPPVALERVAAMLVEVEIAAGDVLISQGAPGDRAYLVAEGELVAERDGLEIGRIERGSVVGEIALLRDAPRMATVRAVRDCRLLAIDRDEFLAAATGSAGARQASDVLVSDRLAVLAE